MSQNQTPIPEVPQGNAEAQSVHKSQAQSHRQSEANVNQAMPNQEAIDNKSLRPFHVQKSDNFEQHKSKSFNRAHSLMKQGSEPKQAYSHKSQIQKQADNQLEGSIMVEVQWQTAYMDRKFFLSDPESLARLKALQQQIQQQKMKLAQVEDTAQLQKTFLSQYNYGDGEKSENMDCLTEVNESKFFERKRDAELDLQNEEVKYRKKIDEMKRRKSILKKQIGSSKDQSKLENNIQYGARQNATNMKTKLESEHLNLVVEKHDNTIKTHNFEQQTDRINKETESPRKASVNSVRLSAKKEQNNDQEGEVLEGKIEKNQSINGNSKKDSVRKSVSRARSSNKTGRYQVQINLAAPNNSQILQKESLMQSAKNEAPPRSIKQDSDRKSKSRFEGKNQGKSQIQSAKKLPSQKSSMKQSSVSQRQAPQGSSVHKNQEGKSNKISSHNSSLQQQPISNDNLLRVHGGDHANQKSINSSMRNNGNPHSQKSYPSHRQQKPEESVKSKSKSKHSQIADHINNNLEIFDIRKSQKSSIGSSKKSQNKEISKKSKELNQHGIQINLDTDTFKKVDKSIQWQNFESQNPHPVRHQINTNTETQARQNIKKGCINQQQVQISRVSQSKKGSRPQSGPQSFYQSQIETERQQPNQVLHAYTSQISESRMSQQQRISEKEPSESPNKSSKKQNHFKIHSRESSVKSKSSKSNHYSKNQSQQKDANNSSSVISQLQIRRLNDQISELQEKLRLVEEKQEKLIKYENNQSRNIYQEESQGGSSEAGSPLARVNFSSRLKIQNKLSFQGATVQFNAYEQKMKKVAQENKSMEKLHLQQQIGRLKKVIRDMQIEKIKSIEYEDQSKINLIRLKKPSQQKEEESLPKYSRVSQNESSHLSRAEEQMQDSRAQNLDNSGKIKKNSPVKLNPDSPKKYNRINAEKSKEFSQLNHEDNTIIQSPSPIRNKGGSIMISRQLNRQQLMSKVQRKQKQFQEFLEASRLIQQPESIVEPHTFIKETKNSRNQYQSISPSNSALDKNFSQIIEKIKRQNPEQQIIIPKEIKISNIQIPNLPSTPNLNMNQQQLLQTAKQTYQQFGLNIEQNQHMLCMKKYKNCVIFTFGSSLQNTILWHYSGKFYFGGWQSTSETGQGQKIGEGLEYVPDKHIYKGQFLGGKKNGNGIIKMANGNIYEGQWTDGIRNGRGTYFESSTQTYYSGEWRDGKREGFGTLRFSDSQFYEGTFFKSVKQGYGAERFSNGDYYKGEYRSGNFHGKGRYIWSNGSSYEGDFVEGCRHGQGNWKSSKKSGDIYIGSYESDKKCGYGRYVWANGCVYQGYFKDDLKNGKGRLIDQDGKEVKGIWQEGNLISSNLDARRLEDHEQEPLYRSIKASPLKNSVGPLSNSFRVPQL